MLGNWSSYYTHTRARAYTHTHTYRTCVSVLKLRNLVWHYAGMSSDFSLSMVYLGPPDPTRCLQATSGLRPLVTKPAKLFIFGGFVTTYCRLICFRLCALKDLKKNIMYILSVALCTNSTHDTDFKTLL
jgi:hypothetical protein